MAAVAPLQPLAVSVNTAAALLGVHRSTVAREIAAERLPAVRIGKRVLVPVRALEARLSTNPQAGTK